MFHYAPTQPKIGRLWFGMVLGWSPIRVDLFMWNFIVKAALACLRLPPWSMEGRFQCCPVAALAQTVNKKEMRRKYRNAICATRTMARAVSRSRRISKQYFWNVSCFSSLQCDDWNGTAVVMSTYSSNAVVYSNIYIEARKLQMQHAQCTYMHTLWADLSQFRPTKQWTGIKSTLHLSSCSFVCYMFILKNFEQMW